MSGNDPFDSSTDIRSDTGPHGMFNIRIVRRPVANGVGHARLLPLSHYEDRRGIVAVYDSTARAIADAWLRKECEKEWEQAMQWFADLVGSVHGIEVKVE